MHRLIGRLCLLLTLLAFPALAGTPSPMTTWNKDHPLPARLGPFALTASRTPAKGDDGGDVLLHVTDADGRAADIKVEIAFDDVEATLGVGRIDPDSPRPQLLITSYTGGAHCCVRYQLLDFVGGGWRTVDVGLFDGEPVSDFPRDVDGDGIADIVRWDDRFAYAFSCYACSWMPPRVFNVRGGQVRDVSAAPRYRPLFLKDYRGARKQCLKHDNAACAGLVADGYRLGRAGEAWAFAMAHIDRQDDWGLPGCKVKVAAGECPEARAFHQGEFRAALAQFLKDNGIAPEGR